MKRKPISLDEARVLYEMDVPVVMASLAGSCVIRKKHEHAILNYAPGAHEQDHTRNWYVEVADDDSAS